MESIGALIFHAIRALFYWREIRAEKTNRPLDKQ